MQNNYYLLETSYIDDGTVDPVKMLYAIVPVLAPLAAAYEADLVLANKNVPHEKYHKQGILEEGKESEIVKKVLDWFFRYSMLTDAPSLRLYRGELKISESVVFDSHEGFRSLYLHLTVSEFKDLQEVLKKAGFPKDLFYDGDEVVNVKAPGFWGWLGFQKCYTPREYKQLGTK